MKRYSFLLIGILVAFAAAQIWIIYFAANGPFVDEGNYIVAGMRLGQGFDLAGLIKLSPLFAVGFSAVKIFNSPGVVVAQFDVKIS